MSLSLRSDNIVPLVNNPVRFGEPVDEAQIRLLLMLGHAENSIFKLNLNKAIFIMQRLLFTPWLSPADQGLRGCFGVIGPRGGTLEALAMVVVNQGQWYSSSQFLEEFIVYVHPEYRRKPHATHLIEWMISASDRLGIPLLTGILTQKRMEAKCRLYARKFTPVGQFFLHMPEHMRWESDVIMSAVPSSSAA